MILRNNTRSRRLPSMEREKSESVLVTSNVKNAENAEWRILRRAGRRTCHYHRTVSQDNAIVTQLSARYAGIRVFRKLIISNDAYLVCPRFHLRTASQELFLLFTYLEFYFSYNIKTEKQFIYTRKGQLLCRWRDLNSDE